MAHSFVQAHDDEETAFRHFARTQPENAVLLIDTYDTARAARTVAGLAEEGIDVKAVRIDSGDLAFEARQVRSILDQHGHSEINIFASGDLDEWRIRDLLGAGAPIDGFGVGTKLDTSADQPYLTCAYKLQEYDGRPRRKRSPGKASWPGRRQIFRRLDADNRMRGDLVGLASEEHPSHPLLETVMVSGRRIAPKPSLTDVREHCRGQLAALPDELKQLDGDARYPITISESLRSLAEQTDTLNNGGRL
jgi:nicotinate phosphoribosyltransferase